MATSWRDKIISMPGYLVANICMFIAFGIYITCFFATLGPMSKQFHFTDTKIGFINTADDIGRIPFLLITAYFGTRWHVPRILGFVGCAYSVLAIAVTVPFFLFKFGKGGNELSAMSGGGAWGLNGTIATPAYLCNASGGPSMNEAAILQMEYSDNIAYYVLIVASVLMGVVGSPWASLFMWYIDENADKKKFPFLIGILWSTYMIGPIIGSYLAAAVNKIPVDLTDSGLTPKDPMFISAWWLGLLIGASLSFIASPILCIFPRTMKSDADINTIAAVTKNIQDGASDGKGKAENPSDMSTELEENDMENMSAVMGAQRKTSITRASWAALTQGKRRNKEKQKNYRRAMNNIYTFKNIPRLIIRLLINPVFLMFNVVQLTWRYEYGGQLFMFKFFAAQFDLAAWEASAILGTLNTISSVMSAMGVLIGGWIVYKFKPSFSQATAYCACMHIVIGLLTVGQVFLGCTNFTLDGLDASHNQTKSMTDLNTGCNVDCDCSTFAYMPVCDGRQSYFSPCHAGCYQTNSSSHTSTDMVYVDCKCTESGMARSGTCERQCSSYYIYAVIAVLKTFAESCTWSAMTLLLIRCVHPTEKALALGLRAFLTSLLALPVAMVYGAAIDSTCLVWQDTFRSDKSHGVCWVYDYPIYRLRFWGIVLAFRLLEIAVEFVIVLYTRKKNIPMYEDDVLDDEKTKTLIAN